MNARPPVVDAHQHVWDPAVADYPWMSGDARRLARAYDQPDVQPELDRAGIDATVLVQAADNLQDTANMFRVAAAHPGIAGVVVWLPLHDLDACTRLLDRWRDRPVAGARHLVHREPDPRWLARADVQPGLDLLARRGLSFDVCAETPALLAQVPALARRHPTLRLVVDHLGKPPVREGGWQPWADLLADAAAVPSVVAKVSGLNTAAAPGWTASDFQPYVDHALAVFGPDRLMYGGDWPFSLLAADSYGHVHRALTATLDRLPAGDRAAVLGGTACRVYGLPR